MNDKIILKMTNSNGGISGNKYQYKDEIPRMKFDKNAEINGRAVRALISQMPFFPVLNFVK